MNFEKWWQDIGSGIIPDKDDDTESHTKKVCEILFNSINDENK